MMENESVNDIIAEIRAYGAQPPPRFMWLEIADRLESAWKRERAFNAMTEAANERLREHLQIALEGNKKPGGNAAATREALKKARLFIGCSLFEVVEVNFGYLDRDELCTEIDAALSAPARNCDLYATATEALKAQDVAFNEDNFKNGECRLGCPGCDDGLIDCKILWLFAPAAERKGANDGR